MYKKLSIALLLNGFAAAAQAQDSARYKLSEHFRQDYDFYLRRVITQSLLPLEQYALTEGSYQKTKGGFRARHEAPSLETTTFYTEGSRRVKKYRVSGSFSYTHTLKDSVAYLLRDEMQAAPYYFFAAAKGNWEVSRYQLQGIVSRPLGNRLSGTLGAAYKAGNAWRSSDPRTEEFNHRVSIEGALHWKLHARHTLGASAGYSVAAEENSNNYQNKDRQDNMEDTYYLNYMQYGFGYIEPMNTSRRVDAQSKGKTLQGVYRGDFTAGTLALTGSYTDQHSSFFRNSTSTSTSAKDYGQFDETIWTGELLWKSLRKGAYGWSLLASYKDHLGRDFNLTLNGNNYVYYQSQWAVRPVIGLWRKDRLQYELALNGALVREYRADGVANHTFDYKNGVAGATLAGYFSGKNPKNFLRLAAGGQWSKNLRDEMHVAASQESDFSKEVAYYNYYYYGANVRSLSFEALYNFSVRNIAFFVKSGVQHQKASLPAYSLPAATQPGTERWRAVFALGFTL